MGTTELNFESSESHIGTVGWACIGAFVLAWDLLAEETLSSAVDRALEHPIGKYAAIGAVALTGAHLLNLYQHFGIPDPIVKGVELLERIRDGARTN